MTKVAGPKAHSQSSNLEIEDKYREHVKSLNQMGVGVVPGASNLRETIISVFPHFKDLDLILRGNPSFDAQPFTSNQQMNRSEDMLSLVRGGATCPGDNLFTTNSGELAAPQDNSATGDQGIGGTPWGEYDHGGTGEDDGQAGGTSYRRDDDFGGMSYRRDNDIGGTFDDIEMYEGTENDADATSAGIQTWIRATPQTKHCTKSWDSCDTSKFTETSHHWGTHASTSGSTLPSTSQPHHHFASPYSQSSEMSLTRGRKLAVGHAKTDIQTHLDNLRHEAKLLKEERASNSSNKYEYAIHSKELVFCWEEAIHQ
ncbi:hypothetical protein EDD17DRAFT_1517454 [Pisolithus thermaeus]|nr:hypothetical protein EDD17DRAFT_1517454 [Pisolithus thermaeus]